MCYKTPTISACSDLLGLMVVLHELKRIACYVNLSPNQKFPYLDSGAPVPIQSENAASLLPIGSGRCLEVSDHRIFAKATENETIVEIKHWPE